MKLSHIRWVPWLVSAAVLAACGGGTDTDGDDADTPLVAESQVIVPYEVQGDAPVETMDASEFETDTTQAIDVPAHNWGAGAQADEAEQFETPSSAHTSLALSASSEGGMRSDFEQRFSERAPGWVANHWGGPRFQTARETAPGNVRSGAASQRFRVDSRGAGADVHLTYPFGFHKGKTYRLTLYLKASRATTAVVQLRRDAPPWQAFAEKTVRLSGEWQRVDLEGRYDWSVGGSIRLVALETGVNIYMDDVSLREVSTASPASVSGSTGTTSTTTRTASGGINLPAASQGGSELIRVAQSGAEGSYQGIAPGWRLNEWGSPTPRWAASRETRAAYVRSGAASQRLRVDSMEGNSAVQLVYPYAFAKGKKYRATVYLRSDRPATVDVFMRRDAHPWDPFASKTVRVGTQWQKVEVTGSYLADVGGTLRIAPRTMGATVWIDDMSIAEVVHNEFAPARSEPVPARMFGMHLNKFGMHRQWPDMNLGVVRLWNTGTTWRDLEPVNDAWDFTSGRGQRLDDLVNHVKSNSPRTDILYTLGQTPLWASRSPESDSLFGHGASGAPRNMADWRDYVRTLARRYAGQIRYWELWNEPDYRPHFNGSVADMVEMARIAREELRAAHPDNRLIAPGVTSGQGMTWLNQFLAAGGGEHVDIMAFHWYYSTAPENLAPFIDNVRQLMATYGVGHKELWNTEGAPGCSTRLHDCDTFVPTAQQSRSVTPRALMVMWAKGVSNYNYYFWERTEQISRLVESDFRTPTQAALTYREMASWMKGARLVDAYKVADKVHVFRMNRDGRNQVVVWSSSGNTTVNLPAGWGLNRSRTLLGAEAPLPASRQITVGIEPVLLMQ